METYDWTGKEPPGEDNPHPDGDFVVQRQCWPGEENLSEEDWKKLELKWSEEERAGWEAHCREERNKKARENYQARKEALQVPVEFQCDEEMSGY